MVSKTYVDFPSSERGAPTLGSLAGPVPASEKIEVSLYLKPRHDTSSTDHKGGDPRADMRARRARQHGGDIKLIEAFAHEAGLTIVTVDPGRRLIRLAGPADKMEAAFRTKLHHYHHGKTQFRGRTGRLHLPEDVAPIVESVLGLDTRPAAQPRLIRHPNAAAATSYLPTQVGAFYQYPSGVTGAGQCIALIELGGGYLAADINAAFAAMGLAPPRVVAVSVDGGTNAPTPDDGANAEVALDIQVSGGVAPGAKIAVYFAPNTDAGFVDAITTAAHDETNKPSVISISWGGPESSWTAQSQQSMTSALADAGTVNVSVFAASGDNLATDGVTDGKAHVDFPASSPNAIGCGGTAITVSKNAITAEAVWNDKTSGGGGGISDTYPVPSFQENAKLPTSVNDGHAGRGVPDVSGNASPESGYKIVVNGAQSVVGGTSAVAPLWAGLTALINQKAATPIGFFLPSLYANTSLLRDITSGSNIPSGSTVGYKAGAGWDACTGLGVPNGQALFTAFTAAAPAPAPSPAPTSTGTFTYTLTVTLDPNPVLTLGPSVSA
jgi:kumamolisin